MASGKAKWDIDILQNSINTLSTEMGNLRSQRDQMKTEQSRVDTNWKSPAGQQYQNRLQNDMSVIGNIVTQLDTRVKSIRGAMNCYTECESKITTALRRLP